MHLDVAECEIMPIKPAVLESISITSLTTITVKLLLLSGQHLRDGKMDGAGQETANKLEVFWRCSCSETCRQHIELHAAVGA